MIENWRVGRTRNKASNNQTGLAVSSVTTCMCSVCTHASLIYYTHSYYSEVALASNCVYTHTVEGQHLIKYTRVHCCSVMVNCNTDTSGNFLFRQFRSKFVLNHHQYLDTSVLSIIKSQLHYSINCKCTSEEIAGRRLQSFFTSSSASVYTQVGWGEDRKVTITLLAVTTSARLCNWL